MANGNATQPAMICVPAAMVPDSRVYLLGNMIYVMALENSIRGLLDAFFTVQNRGWSTNVKIVMLCNLWLISKYVLDVVHAFLPLEPPAKGGAQKWGFMYSISFAMSMITFDAFLLFKTWIVCSKTRFFKIAGIILLLIRTGWAAADIGMSYTECYPGIGCMFQQLPFFLIGNITMDAVIDIACTVYLILNCRIHLKSDIKALIFVFMTENVSRTFFLFVFNCFTLWCFAALDQMSPVMKLVSTQLQSYVTAVALNSEFYWVRKRNEMLPDTGLIQAIRCETDPTNYK